MYVRNEKRYPRVEFAVEATDWERTELVTKNLKLLIPSDNDGIKVYPVSIGHSIIPTIGYIADRPITVCLTYVSIADETVLFYEGLSRLVDHKMIEEWITEHYLLPVARGKLYNTSSFMKVMYEIAERQKSKKLQQEQAMLVNKV
jgi:hypothetical protein